MARKPDTNDTTEMWRDYRHHQAEQRQRRRERRQAELQQVAAAGYVVFQLTEYQYRVNAVLDLYPTAARWHHLPSNRRGGYGRESSLQVVQRLIGK